MIDTPSAAQARRWRARHPEAAAADVARLSALRPAGERDPKASARARRYQRRLAHRDRCTAARLLDRAPPPPLELPPALVLRRTPPEARRTRERRQESAREAFEALFAPTDSPSYGVKGGPFRPLKGTGKWLSSGSTRRPVPLDRLLC